MNNPDRVAEERARLLQSERKLPTSGLSRLFRTGRSAGALALATVGNRLRGKDGGLEAADLKDIVKLVERLGELKGVAMKMGQILGYIDPTLPPELRGLLSILHTASPASPWESIEATIQEDLGERGSRLLAGMSREPLAVASIGQVHRAEIDGLDVAVKVRHPGIEEALRSDFSTARVGPTFARMFAPGASESVRESIEEAKTAMLEECDFALEARRQTMFGEWFEGHPVIRIPAVQKEWSTGRILTTRWTPGLSLDALLAADPSQEKRNAIGEALFELYIGTLYKRGVFHADPHPGNYAFGEDGSVIVYDFGCVRSFDGDTVRALSKLVEALRSDEEEAIVSALVDLGAKPPKNRETWALLRRLFRAFFAPLLENGPHRIKPGTGFDAREVMRDKKAVMSLCLPGKLLFLFRIRFGLYSVLSRLNACVDWSALETSWAREAKQ